MVDKQLKRVDWPTLMKKTGQGKINAIHVLSDATDMKTELLRRMGVGGTEE